MKREQAYSLLITMPKCMDRLALADLSVLEVIDLRKKVGDWHSISPKPFDRNPNQFSTSN